MKSLFVPVLTVGFLLSARGEPPANLAPGGTAGGSSQGYGSVFGDANDGNRDGHFYNGGSVWHTLLPDAAPFYEVDLGGTYFLDRVMIWPRTDAPDQGTVENFTLKVLDEAGLVVWTANHWPTAAVNWAWGTSSMRGVAGRKVRYEKRDGSPNYLTFAELEVWGGKTMPTANLARAAGAVVTASPAGLGTTAAVARDGNLNANYASVASPRPVYQSAASAAGTFWQVDLGATSEVDSVILYARQDASPTGNVRVKLLDAAGVEVYAATLSLRRTELVNNGSRFDVTCDVTDTVAARTVRIETLAAEPLALAEVEVFGPPVDPAPPVLTRRAPAPGALLAELQRVEVEFDEDVTGISADDLLVNGVPATGLTALSPRRHAFTFPQLGNGVVALSFAPGSGITDASGNIFAGAAWSVTLDTTLPAPRPVITEFLTENQGGLRDEDEESPDWIEILNPGPVAVNLGGWYLSDSPTAPAKWRFPSPTVLEAGERLVVFASSKDRATAGQPLHTNFKLDPGGESVLLVKPDGVTVASQILGYPPQRENTSFGAGRSFGAAPLLGQGSAARALIPAEPMAGWTESGFDDSAWSAATLGVGFPAASGVRTDLSAVMRGINATAYVRAAFTLPNGALPDLLTLKIRYDDGFVAHLNGVEVARRNAPAVTSYQSTAAAGRPVGAALVAEEIDLSRFAPLLREGANVLALHGLNHTAADGDFLLLPELLAGHSQPDRFFPAPTPGEANAAGVTGFVNDVKFFPKRGFYDAPVTVTLSCDTPGAVLVYTKDGSVPALANGVSGTSPLTVALSGTTTLRATAFQGTLAPTNVDTHTYLFVDQVAVQKRPATAPATWPGGFPADFAMDPRVPGPSPAAGYTLRESLLSLPSLSLTTAPAGLWGTTSGIYANTTSRGREWERFTSVEWLDPAVPEGFHAGAGLRIHGNISRNKDFTPKHGFSLRFRGDYGDPTLHFPLYPGSPVQEFDELVLRAGSTDTWPCTEWAATGLGPNGELHQRWNRDWASYLRDQWVRNTHLAMGREAFRGRYCHLYLNGSYWGLYNVTETPSASHMAAHLGGPEAEWDTVADFNELRDGSRTAWDQLLQMANGGQLGTDAGLRRVQGLAADGTRDPALPRLLDVDNLIDYMILHIYIGADDWPDHNWWGARRSRAEDPEGFRFFAWDQEISNENTAYARSSWGPIYAQADADGTPTRIYARLRNSPEFRLRFADRAQRHLFHDGALSNAHATARWRAMGDEIDHALVAESARWGDAQSNHTRPGQPYTRENAWLPHMAWMAANYWPKQPATALARLRAASLLPTFSAPSLTPNGGSVTPVFSTTLSNPNAAAGTLYYTTNGEDPRLWGGAVHAAALSSTETTVSVTLPANTTVRARIRQGAAWSALTEATFPLNPDLDGDGMEDAWETAHGLSPEDPADAAPDQDGDGWTNAEEYVANTDPRAAASVLSLQAEIVDPASAEITLRFDLQPGRVYVIERAAAPDAPSAWTPRGTFGPEPLARAVEHSEPAAAPRYFYRLRASVAPN